MFKILDNIKTVLQQKEPYHHTYLSVEWYATLMERKIRTLICEEFVKKEDVPLYVIISCDAELDPPSVGEPDKLSTGLKYGLPILLNLMREIDAKGTFFVTALVSKEFPQFIDLIKEEGHEIACHGFSHYENYGLTRYKKSQRLTEQELYKKIKMSKKILEYVSGNSVHSFRAPFTRVSGYTFEILSRLGFHFDSSLPNGVFGKVFPYHPHRKEYWTAGDLPILEIPQSVNPAPSFRQFLLHEPYRGLRELYAYNIKAAQNASKLIVSIAKKSGVPAVIHIPSHSWEFVKIDQELAGTITGEVRRRRLKEFVSCLKVIGANFIPIEMVRNIWTSPMCAIL